MRNTRKILLTLVLTLVFVALLAVAALAAMPQGAVKDGDGWKSAGYKDIDENPGWVYYSYYSSDTAPFRPTTDGTAPKFVRAPSKSKFYYNKDLKTGVLVFNGSVSSDSGEERSISRNDDNTKFVQFAFAIVDNWSLIETHFADKTTDYSQYFGDVPLPTKLDGTSPKAPWAKLYVNHADYQAMKPEFERIDADASITDKRVAKAAIAREYSAYYNNKNVEEAGAFWTLAYLFKLMSADQANYPLETLEVRDATNYGSEFFNFAWTLTTADSVKTIYIDSRITKFWFQTGDKNFSVDRGLFFQLDGLQSLGHVVYDSAKTGEFSTTAAGATFKEGVVSLRGFKMLNSNGRQETKGFFFGCDSITNAEWYSTNMHGDVERAGYIGVETFRYTKKLETLTIPASVELKEIGSKAFEESGIKVIDVKGIVASDMTIGSDAFKGTSGLTIKVYWEQDRINMEKALAAANVTGVTVANDSKTITTIKSTGYSIRKKDANAINKGPALRAEFTLLKSMVDATFANEGLTLDDYGVIVFSANTVDTFYHGDPNAVLAALEAGPYDTKRVKSVSAKNGPYVRVNEAGDITFAAAVTGIREANYTDGVYTYAYAAWTNDGGATLKYTYTTYTSPRTGKTAHSLYDATVFAFRSGIVNSQNTTPDRLWPILEKGAFSVTEADIKPISDLLSLDVQYTFDEEGKFTYLNLPLRAWNMYKNPDGKVQWNSRGVTIEDVSTTNVLWSILTDGDDLVVVYTKAPNAEGDAVLPMLSGGYGAYSPFSSHYFEATASTVVDDPAKNGLYKYGKIYSPIVSDDNAANIKALVVDYGVNKFGSQSLSGAGTIASIAYPEGMTADRYLLSGARALKDFIYVTEDKSYLDKYKLDENDTLIDLTGLSKLNLYGVMYNTSAAENVLFPASNKIDNGGLQYTFAGAGALIRGWTVGSDMPEAGTLDLSKTKVDMIDKGFFTGINGIHDVKMPDTFKHINNYSMAYLKQETDELRWKLFGDNSEETKLNIHVSNWDALNSIANTFYDAHQKPEHNNGSETAKKIVDHLKITYEGETKTVLDWRKAFPAQPAQPAE